MSAEPTWLRKGRKIELFFLAILEPRLFSGLEVLGSSHAHAVFDEPEIVGVFAPYRK